MQNQAALESARALQSIIARKKSIRQCRVTAIAVFMRMVVRLAMSFSSQATVVIFDGFDDADRDNDGLTDDGNNTRVAVNDGIPWFSVNGLIAQGGHKPDVPYLRRKVDIPEMKGSRPEGYLTHQSRESSVPASTFS